MEAEAPQPSGENCITTLERLPDQAITRKIASNDVAPSSKTTDLQSQSLEKLIALEVSKLTKAQAQEWLVFARNNTVEKAVAEEALKAEVEKLKGTVESLTTETRKTNGIKQISDFEKVLGKMISPSFTRPILFQVGFAAIDVSPISL